MVRKRLIDRHRERREEVKKDANDLLISGRVVIAGALRWAVGSGRKSAMGSEVLAERNE